MYSVKNLEVPSLPEGSFKSHESSHPLGLIESHLAFLTSDFALTWMWGDYQRWKFVKDSKGTSFDGPEQNLEVITSTFKGLILLRLRDEIDPNNFPEISLRKVSELVGDLKYLSPERLHSLQDPAEVIKLRLAKHGGWHSDKINMDYRRYDELCKTASSQWSDALEEFGLNTDR